MRFPLSNLDSKFNVSSASAANSLNAFWTPSLEPPMRDLTNYFIKINLASFNRFK